MKIVTAANGKQTIKMSKKEWTNIGKKAGWKVKSEKFLVIDNEFNKSKPSYAQVTPVNTENEMGQKTTPKKELPLLEENGVKYSKKQVTSEQKRYTYTSIHLPSKKKILGEVWCFSEQDFYKLINFWNHSDNWKYSDVPNQLLSDLDAFYCEQLYPLLTQNSNGEFKAELEKFVNSVHNFRKYLNQTPQNIFL